MPRTSTDAATDDVLSTSERVYSWPARFYHWTVATLVIATIPIGFIMADRGEVKMPDGPEKAAFEATTNTMYSSHKLIGLVILALMLARITYRLTRGAPRSEPSLPGWQKGLSHAVHWSLYLLLILVPIGGYVGIMYYGATDIFGVKLPNFVTPNEPLSERIFKLHGLGATIIIGLITLHLAGAAYHGLVKGDGVVRRMWPGTTDPDAKV